MSTAALYFSSMSLPSDSLLGHYEIGAKLDAGGMGEVYLAKDTRLNRKVAIKFLPPATDLENVRRKSENGDLIVPTVDRAATTIRLAVTNRGASVCAFLTSCLGLALAAVVMMVTGAFGYALFFGNSRSVSSSRTKSVNSAAYDYYLRGKVRGRETD